MNIEYVGRGTVFLIGNQDHNLWAYFVEGEDITVTERFTKASFFPSLKEARAALNYCQESIERQDFPRGATGTKLFNFWQEAKVWVVPFKIRDVVNKAKITRAPRTTRKPAAKTSARRPATKAARVREARASKT